MTYDVVLPRDCHILRLREPANVSTTLYSTHVLSKGRVRLLCGHCRHGYLQRRYNFNISGSAEMLLVKVAANQPVTDEKH